MNENTKKASDALENALLHVADEARDLVNESLGGSIESGIQRVPRGHFMALAEAVKDWSKASHAFLAAVAEEGAKAS